MSFQPSLPQHFLNFLPQPQGHGSFRPTLVEVLGGDGSREDNVQILSHFQE
jgi:hypothetical protein